MKIGEKIGYVGDLLEVGIGNGFFSFMMFGGQFKPDFEWYHQTLNHGFWLNRDIYDVEQDASTFVGTHPLRSIHCAIDQKTNLS